MSTDHCPLCQKGIPCGHYHLYVIQFRDEVASEFTQGNYKGYLYVGSTGKSVEDRFIDNYTLKDGTQVGVEEARSRADENVWKYNTKNMRRIRRHYLRHRPDLFYADMNPIVGGKEAAERREKKLVKKLNNRGWKAEGPRLKNE